MSVHIAIGELQWCRSHPILRLALEAPAEQRMVPLTCQHETGATAVALVHLMQDFGIDATIIDGPCEWNPELKDFRKLCRSAK